MIDTVAVINITGSVYVNSNSNIVVTVGVEAIEAIEKKVGLAVTVERVVHESS